MLDRWIGILTKGILIIGPLFLIFWILKPNFLKKFRIKQINEISPRTAEELGLTFINLTMYLIPFFCLVFAKEKLGIFSVYTDINERGIPYFIFSIFLFMIINDTWFYWMHRAMHSIKFFKQFHMKHHQSVNTTPLTAYSFNVGEGLINMGYYIFMIIFVPWHPLALTIFGVVGIAFNSYIHLGYDFAYIARSKNPVLKWINSSTHHSTHHQIFEGNYSVWFTFWDKIMKTEIEDTRIVQKQSI